MTTNPLTISSSDSVDSIEIPTEIPAEIPQNLQSTDSLIPRRIPVGGRVWKTIQSKPNSNMRPKFKRNTWEHKLEMRQAHKMTTMLQQELIDNRVNALAAKKVETKRRMELKQEREKQAEVVQNVSAAKVKRMKKKQLRALQKR